MEDILSIYCNSKVFTLSPLSHRLSRESAVKNDAAKPQRKLRLSSENSFKQSNSVIIIIVTAFSAI